jgi:O-antigen/teichoic acid export membrane protein
MTFDVFARPPNRALARLAAHLRTPLYREGYALMLSAGLASALGLVYWIIAARTYEPSVLGLNSAAISAMLLLSGISQLNLFSALTRFVPDAGRSTWRLVAWSYVVSLAVSAAVAAIFLAGIYEWAPKLGFLRSDEGFVLWFIAATMVWSVFTLQDSVLTALRQAIWVPLDNTIFALTKIALLAIFASSFPRYGIFASWTFGVVLSVVLINAVLAFRLIPAHARSSSRRRPSATPRQIGRFVAADYVGGLFWIAASTLIPIAITQRLGGSANAFFTLAWVMTMPLYLATANIGNSLVVSAVTDWERMREYSHRVFVQTARIVVPTAIGVAALAPFLLRLFGEEYSKQGTTVLRLLALSAIPNMVSALYLSVWRAQQRLSLLIWVRCVQFTCVIVGSVALLGPYGIRGPAIVWLAVQTVVAAVLFLRWPGVLTGGGMSFPRRSAGLFFVRNAAADTGLLTLAQRCKQRPGRRRQLALAAEAVPEVVARLNGNLAEAPSAWALQRVIWTVTEKTVVFIGPPGGSPQAVMKLPGSSGAAHALACEADVLQRMRADPRLEGWRLFPEVIAFGEVDGEPYLVERVVPGVDARRLLPSSSDVPGDLRMIAGVIGELHQRTRTELVLDESILHEWVDEPLAVLARHAARDQGRLWLTTALAHLRAEIWEALLAKRVSVSWVHGDYVPGNVLLDPVDRTVNGIVDWELACSSHLTVLDTIHLILSTRALMQRREFGEVVIGALYGDWTGTERALLERAQERLPGDDLPTRELLLLAWLRHMASMLTKAPGYADNWWWLRSNLEATLAKLA